MQRSDWVTLAERLARPVLAAAAEGRLAEALAPELHASAASSRIVTAPLEAVGRLLAGLGPWLAVTGADAREASLRDELAALACAALREGVDPHRPGYLRFRGPEHQTLVDAAFLAQGILRGRAALWDRLDVGTQRLLHTAMIDLRNRKPYFSNWLLFSAMTEAFLYATGSAPDLMRIDYALRQHEQWYVGDGTYSDGPDFHFDYYNSYVIHPMLTDVLLTMRGADESWDAAIGRQFERHTRAAEIQERLVAPDGSFPIVGRSICYRCGAFHTLAHAALLHLLPRSVSPAQVRSALSAVVARTLSQSANWRPDGFLRIGVAGSQPSLGEPYITTGSLYLAACAFLPLGLPPEDEFWSAPDEPHTAVKVWSLGADVPADHALDRA